MYQRWVRHNKLILSVFIYICLYGLLNLIKPAFLYNEDGSLKNFGVGYRQKTIIPVWLLSILLAIITYFSVMYYSAKIR